MTNIKLSSAFLIIILLINCQPNKNTQNMNTEFKISEYEVSYKDKALPFGKPIEEWEKVFGKYDRVEKQNYYYWDSLGIKLVIGESGKITPSPGEKLTEIHKIVYKTDVLHIYMKNMYPKSEYPAPKISVDGKEQTYTEDKEYPINYYKKAINYEGAELNFEMSLTEMNEKRNKNNIPKLYDFYEANGSYINVTSHSSGKKVGDDGKYKSNTEDIEGKSRLYGLSLYIKENLIEHIEIQADFENGVIPIQ